MFCCYFAVSVSIDSSAVTTHHAHHHHGHQRAQQQHHHHHPDHKAASVSAALSGTTGSNSTSTDSERTYRVDSQDSQVSDTETNGSGDRHWPRQNSVRTNAMTHIFD